MLSPILAFRPASVVVRLPPRSGACPLSARELLAAAGEVACILPIVRAPIAGVARGALVAAKELSSPLGLHLPAGVPARPWFDAVARTADELAVALPLFFSAELAVTGEGGVQVAQASSEAWGLVDAGLTHLAVDVSSVVPAQRGRVLVEVARAAFERGVSVEVAVPLGEGRSAGPRAAALWEEVSHRGVAPDAASVRCPAAATAEEARLQALALARLSQALDGVPVIRRGPVSPAILELLSGSPVRACEDGGAAADRGLALLPGVAAEEGDAPPRGESRLERAAAALPPDGLDRLEARAYVETLDLVERLGACGTSHEVTRALSRRLVDR